MFENYLFIMFCLIIIVTNGKVGQLAKLVLKTVKSICIHLNSICELYVNGALGLDNMSF